MPNKFNIGDIVKYTLTGTMHTIKGCHCSTKNGLWIYVMEDKTTIWEGNLQLIPPIFI